MSGRGRIFISYRRGDVAGDARGICDRLERKFGKANVFIDVDKLLPGQRFDRELDKALSQCDVLIAVIGARWMQLLSEHSGKRDFLREEIAAALTREIIVIPVLVGQEGQMPALPERSDLPEDIRDLVQHQKHGIAHETFNRDADQLTAAIGVVLRGGNRARPRWAIAISVAIALAITLTSLGYWMNILPVPRPGQVTLSSAPGGTDAGSRAQLTSDTDRATPQESARRKAADEEANKKAADEAKRQADANTDRKKVEEDAANKKAAADCDRLAASPFDGARPIGVAGVEFNRVDPAAAAMACDDAVRRYPEVARFVYQAGRAEQARKNYSKALERFRTAITMGSPIAMAALGFLYANGEGVPEDYVKAREWYEKAAALGNAIAMTNLAGLYRDGQGGAQNYETARALYEKSAALGNGPAMYGLGIIYENGEGVTKNIVQARKWYQKAADAGIELAKERLKTLK